MADVIPSMEELVEKARKVLNQYLSHSQADVAAKNVLAAVLPLVLVPAGEALEPAQIWVGRIAGRGSVGDGTEVPSAVLTLMQIDAAISQLRAPAETAKGGG